MNEQDARQQICEIGRRMYAKDFVAGHEGNLSIRIDDEKILCTPTLRCKGVLNPDEICVVDFDGRPLEGSAKPTSEIRLHLTVYRNRPDVRGVVHSHAPHATAFAVAREPVPNCVLAEPDLFLGEIAIAPFETPGSQAFADSVLPFVQQTNAILLANHGVVTYGTSLEEAFWMTEILDATCKTLLLSKLLGGPQRLTPEQGKELARTRSNFGFQDPRPVDDPACDVCDHWLFKSTWEAAGVKGRSFAIDSPAIDSPAIDSPANDSPANDSPANDSSIDTTVTSLDEASCQRIADMLSKKLRPERS